MRRRYHCALSKWSHCPPPKGASLTTNVEMMVMAYQSDSLWLLCHDVSSIPPKIQPDPGRKGWVSCTGARSVKRQTTIDKLAPVDAPITENITISECLTKSLNLTAAVGQTSILVGMGCGEAMMAYKMNSILLNITKCSSSNSVYSTKLSLLWCQFQIYGWECCWKAVH